MPRSLRARPPRLAELQGWLARVWTTPEGIRAALASREGRAALPWILGGDRAPARERLAVYADAYFSRLLESLGADFAAAKRALGDGEFRRLIAAYLAARPSDSYNICDAGAGLADFSSVSPQARRFPFLPDLCRLEWRVLRALLTDRLPDPDPASFSSVAVERWDDARLALDPTLALLKSRWPVHELWEDRAEPARGASLSPKATFIAVWRDSEWVRVEAIEERAWRTLARLAEGKPLGRACALSQARPAELRAWFSSWVAGGVVKGVTIP